MPYSNKIKTARKRRAKAQMRKYRRLRNAAIKAKDAKCEEQKISGFGLRS